MNNQNENGGGPAPQGGEDGRSVSPGDPKNALRASSAAFPHPWYWADLGSGYLLLASDKRRSCVITAKAEPRGRGSLVTCGPDGVFTPVRPDNPNMILMAAAPELAWAMRELHESLDVLAARLMKADHTFLLSQSGRPMRALLASNSLFDKLAGKRP